LAEYLVCSSDRIVLKPPHLKPTEASGLCLVGLTAYQGLFNIGQLKQGQSIFVNGGGTSVGLAAIQLAKATGCVVGASASAQKEELMRSLGVDTVRIFPRDISNLSSPRNSSLIIRGVQFISNWRILPLPASTTSSWKQSAIQTSISIKTATNILLQEESLLAPALGLKASPVLVSSCILYLK
jgi:threonine dehydrogenase-like Zn-dependent dehydrogenase